jgi:DNA-binding transcriptional LysR family regulator
MDLDAIATLDAIHRTGSLSSAAREQSPSPPLPAGSRRWKHH